MKTNEPIAKCPLPSLHGSELREEEVFGSFAIGSNYLFLIFKRIVKIKSFFRSLAVMDN
jgi:hypothetical protein